MGYLSNSTYSVCTDLPYEQSYVMSQGLTKSLCLQHPVHGQCPLAHKSHDRPECEQCAVYGRGTCNDPLNWEPPKSPASDRRLSQCDHPGCFKLTRNKYCRKHAAPCAHKWCENKTLNEYCSRCMNLMNTRTLHWQKQVGTEVDQDWLHRPVDMRRSKAARGKRT